MLDGTVYYLVSLTLSWLSWKSQFLNQSAYLILIMALFFFSQFSLVIRTSSLRRRSLSTWNPSLVNLYFLFRLGETTDSRSNFLFSYLFLPFQDSSKLFNSFLLYLLQQNNFVSSLNYMFYSKHCS